MITILRPCPGNIIRGSVTRFAINHGHAADKNAVNDQIRFLVTGSRWLHCQSPSGKVCGHQSGFKWTQRTSWTRFTTGTSGIRHGMIVTRTQSTLNQSRVAKCDLLAPKTTPLMVTMRTFYRKYEFGHRIKENPLRNKTWFESWFRGGGIVVAMSIAIFFDWYYIANSWLPYSWVRFYYEKVYNPIATFFSDILGLEFHPIVFPKRRMVPVGVGEEDDEEFEDGDVWVGFEVWEEIKKGVNYIREERKRSRSKVE